MKKRRERRSIEFRTLQYWCCMHNGGCLDEQSKSGECNATDCPTWKRLKKLNYVARTKDDGAFYEVYWVKTK